MQLEALNKCADSSVKSEWLGWGTPVTLILPGELGALMIVWFFFFPRYKSQLYKFPGNIYIYSSGFRRHPAWNVKELSFFFSGIQDQERAYGLKMKN